MVRLAAISLSLLLLLLPDGVFVNLLMVFRSWPVWLWAMAAITVLTVLPLLMFLSWRKPTVKMIPATDAGKTPTAFHPGWSRMDARDREFLPAALEIMQTPPSPVRIAMLVFICMAFGTALLWSYVGWLEIHAVAEGRVQPNGKSKVIQPLEPGKVIRIAVENGQRVQAGDLLLELDPRETDADRVIQARELEAARAEAMRRKTAVTSAENATGAVPALVSYPPETSIDIITRENAVLSSDLGQLFSTKAHLLAQRDERRATRERLKSSLAARAKLLALTKEHLEMRESLNKMKFSSRVQVIEISQTYETQMTTQAGEEGQLAETEAAILTLERKIEETLALFIAEQTQKLAEAQRRADHIAGELVKASAKHERTRLTAPITGTVQQLAVTTVGQVVTTGQSLLTIVPFDTLIEIEAMVENHDIGFVEPGMSAVVKVESFPFTRYGTLEGNVVKVSRDAVDERDAIALSDPKSSMRPQLTAGVTSSPKNQHLVYPATIRLAKNTMIIDGKTIALTPGMAVTVEIQTGQRRALDFVLSPLREVASRAGNER